jgi:hypothetical protein
MNREFSERELLVAVLEVLLSAHESGGLSGDGIFYRLKAQTGLELDEDAAFKRLVPMVQNLEKQGYIAEDGNGWVLTDEGIDYASKNVFQKKS